MSVCVNVCESLYIFIGYQFRLQGEEQLKMKMEIGDTSWMQDFIMRQIQEWIPEIKLYSYHWNRKQLLIMYSHLEIATHGFKICILYIP